VRVVLCTKTVARRDEHINQKLVHHDTQAVRVRGRLFHSIERFPHGRQSCRHAGHDRHDRRVVGRFRQALSVSSETRGLSQVRRRGIAVRRVRRGGVGLRLQLFSADGRARCRRRRRRHAVRAKKGKYVVRSTSRERVVFISMFLL